MFEIILGTYEEFLLGYNFNSKTTEKCCQTFALHSHSSSVRSVAASGKFLASGSADDRIIVYDMKNRKELCMLTHHSGTVNCLAFTKDNTHLISGSQDGVLSIVRTGNWQVEKLWDKAHKGAPILDLALHSSGKLLLTLGTDCTLRTWNLIKGRQAYAINLNNKCKDAKSLQSIQWSPGGVLFALIGGKYTDIWSIETGGVIKSIEHKERVAACCWIDDENLIAGYDNGQVSKFNIKQEEGEEIKETYECHKTRVKVLTIYKTEKKEIKYLITGASDGQIKVFKLKSMKEVAKYESGCRLTCIAATELFKKDVKEENEDNKTITEEEKPKKLKQKAVVVIEEEADEDEDVHKDNNKKSKGKNGMKKKKRKLSA